MVPTLGNALIATIVVFLICLAGTAVIKTWARKKAFWLVCWVLLSFVGIGLLPEPVGQHFQADIDARVSFIVTQAMMMIGVLIGIAIGTSIPIRGR